MRADACGPQTVLDALRARKDRFVFDNVEVTLKPSVMAFITMNPGYPGRAELPESLKVRCSQGAAHHQPTTQCFCRCRRSSDCLCRRSSGPAACVCRT